MWRECLLVSFLSSRRMLYKYTTIDIKKNRGYQTIRFKAIHGKLISNLVAIPCQNVIDFSFAFYLYSNLSPRVKFIIVFPFYVHNSIFLGWCRNSDDQTSEFLSIKQSFTIFYSDYIKLSSSASLKKTAS